MDCGTEIVSNKHDVWTNRGMVEKYLVEHTLPISKRMGADITDVCAGTDINVLRPFKLQIEFLN